MSIVVTGGSGYIGSHVVRLLQQRNEHVIVVDQHEPKLQVPHINIDLSLPESVSELTELFVAHEVSAAIHFAARKQVGESVARPLWYYQQNVTGLINLLQAMENADVTKLVFSSSAAVYGEPNGGIARESSVPQPINPYGETKLIGEWLIHNQAVAHDLKHVSLRYFNVAGSGWEDLGDPYALNLIPIILHRHDRGEQPIVFGGDYETYDGTCIRDYVHVLDLAEAHLVALDYLDRQQRDYTLFNIGTGKGSSVLDVISAVSAAMDKSLDPVMSKRRQGDPPQLTADVTLATAELDWVARYGLAEIAQSAVKAHRHLFSES